MSLIEAGLAFDELELRNVISEAWSRGTGQPYSTQVTNSARAPGFFGLTQKRRDYLFKLPAADPILPDTVGEYPRFQTDIIRAKHNELVARLVENKFRVDCQPASERIKDKARADIAERVLGYGAQLLQERQRVDWQKALAQGVSAYGMGVLHWRVDHDADALTPDPEYLDALPEGADARDYQPASEIPDADTSKGKYRERADAVLARTKLAKSRAPLPIHVEIVAADAQMAVWDVSTKPGPATVIHIKEVGIIDYNGQLAKEGFRLSAEAGGSGITLSLEELNPASGVAMERTAPSALNSPSIAGYRQRISVAYVWTRDECYELVAPTLLTGAQTQIIGTTDWTLVKGYQHGYGRCPFVYAFGSVEENEWDPALRYRPALDGLYQQAPLYNYTRSLEMKYATDLAIQTYVMTQNPAAPPIGEGDEEGDTLVLPQHSNQAALLPPGSDVKGIGPTDMSPAFARSRELNGQELAEAAPPTGSTEITATTQPWTARLGQAQSNAYPKMLLGGIADALAEMFRNWVELAGKDADAGGFGTGLYVPAASDDGVTDFANAVGLEPKEWAGIWLDVIIDAVSSAERVTQIQMGLQLVNNPVPVRTPEMFVSEDLGVQDATAYMREVDSYQAAAPFKKGLYAQAISKVYANKTVVGADGTLVNAQGGPVDPTQLLAQHGIRPQTPAGPPAPPSPNMPGLPTMAGQGAPPAAGIPAPVA